MFVIHKIELRPGLSHYDLPLGAELLHVAMQRATPMLWYKRPMIVPGMENRILLLTGTGHEFDPAPKGSDWKFIGSMLTKDQTLVFHVFELVHEPMHLHLAGDQLMGEGR